MSNLEHLIENGLCLLDEGKSYREWRELMQQDVNWDGNEEMFITVDTLWEICQYVIFTWDSDKEEIVRCKDCVYSLFKEGAVQHGYIFCTKPFTERWQAVKPNNWYCADGERKEGR